MIGNPMSSQEVMLLLAVVGSYDARTTGPSEVAAWSQAAQRARWTYAEAADAVHEHFAFDSKNTWLMPGMVTSMVRAARQRRADREDPSDRATPGDLKVIPTGDDPHWGRRNSPDLEEVHAETMPFPCAYCGAQVGGRCVNKVTGNATKIPHAGRLVAARKAAR